MYCCCPIHGRCGASAPRITCERCRLTGASTVPGRMPPRRRPLGEDAGPCLSTWPRRPRTGHASPLSLPRNIRGGAPPPARLVEFQGRPATALQRNPLRDADGITDFYLRHTPSLRRFKHQSDLLSMNGERLAPDHHSGGLRPSPVSHARYRNGHVARPSIVRPRVPPWRRSRDAGTPRFQRAEPRSSRLPIDGRRQHGSAPSPFRFTAKPSRAFHG